MALSRADALSHMDTTKRKRAIAPAVGGGRWTVDGGRWAVDGGRWAERRHWSAGSTSRRRSESRARRNNPWPSADTGHLELVVRLLVESEDRATTQDEDWPLDQVRLLEHQRDGLPLRRGQRALPEHRAAAADVLEEVRLVDVLLEKSARGRRPVDVTLLDLDPALCQMTSGILTGRSGWLPVEDRLRHIGILTVGG